MEELWNMARDAAREAWEDMMRNQIFDMYLYFKPGQIRAFHADRVPEGWSLALAERVPCNIDERQLTSWIANNCRRVPCLAI